MKALQLLREQAKEPDSSLEGYQGTKNYLQQLGQYETVYIKPEIKEL